MNEGEFEIMLPEILSRIAEQLTVITLILRDKPTEALYVILGSFTMPEVYKKY